MNRRNWLKSVAAKAVAGGIASAAILGNPGETEARVSPTAARAWARWLVGVVRSFLDWLARFYVGYEVVRDVRDVNHQQAEIVVRCRQRDGRTDTWVCRVDGASVRTYRQ